MKYSKRHLFGQHFISDARLLRRIVELAQLNDNTSVMEIGAGRGNLTKYIAQKAGRVLAVELDKELYAQAAIALRSYKNVKLIQGNILDMNDAGVDVIITSLPYSISARFIEWLSGQGCIRAIAILQEDFANKLVQEVRGKNIKSTLSKISTTYSEFVIPEINDNKRRIECLTPEEFMYLISYMQLKRNVFTQS